MDSRNYFLVIIVFLFLFFSGCNLAIRGKEKKARESFKNHKYSEAIDVLETINPEKRTININILLGRAYGAIFEFEKADCIFKQTLKRNPSVKESLLVVYMSVAHRYEKRKRIDLAIEAYNSLLQIENEYNIESGFYILGHYYFLQNNLPEAMKYLEKGIQSISEPDLLKKTKIELMDVYETLGIFDKAFEISADETSKDINYRRGKISFKLAKKLFSKEQFDSALVYCESILVINTPKTLIDDTYFLMGDIYSERGNYSKALKCYKQVIKLDRYGKNRVALVARRKIEAIEQLSRGRL
jgi:tetratricopeptide (TPR) repeat protein